jgi:MinD-like ATPase involved in chromosome partitioning or flagellar assembly
MRVAFCGPEQTVSPLAADAVRWGHETVAVVTAAAAADVAIADTSPHLVVVAASADMLSPGLLAVADARGARVVALAADDSERRHALSVGIHDVLVGPATWSDVDALVSGVVAPMPSALERRGIVVAVWGPAGAPGRTSIAVAVAAELALRGLTVAVADVDTHAASVAPTLGLLDEAPGFAAACRLAGVGGLDRAELERIGQWYPLAHAGLWVLTGLSRSSRWPELSADRVRTVLGECRRWVDVTVVDTGASIETDEEISSDMFAPRRNAATITALEEADLVLAVGSADPVGIARFLRAHLDLLELRGAEGVNVVMNRVRASVIGAAPGAQVSQTLQRFGGVEAAALVPYDRAGFDAALLTGRTIAEVAPRSPARAQIRRLAHTIDAARSARVVSATAG